MRRFIRKAAGLLVCLTVLFGQGISQPENDDLSGRIGISAGMGVNYHNAQDIVNRVNSFSIISQRAQDFKSGVEFFGIVSLPLSEDWVVKAEYVYMLASYNQTTQGGFGPAEFSYDVHMPTLIGQYMLYDAGTYNFKVGVGFGYHFGTYKEKIAQFQGEYTAKGLGSLLELEGNTGLGTNLYAHLGTQARWDFIGDLKNENGNSPTGSATATTLHFFSIGARLGVTYYF
ncbi:MAG: hypothetical protein HY961_01345 [Ignavibacteriae bacterium]|nr:hypothetical protein [Ignavibacteriota bacterium]